MGQLIARNHVLRNNVHEWSHNLLVIHLCLIYLVLFLFPSHFFHSSYISNSHCYEGLGLSVFLPWILCHSYFPYILHLSFLSAGVLVQKIDTLVSVNYHTHMQTCSQCCLWSIAKHFFILLHSLSSALFLLIFVCANFSSWLLFCFFLLISNIFWR